MFQKNLNFQFSHITPTINFQFFQMGPSLISHSNIGFSSCFNLQPESALSQGYAIELYFDPALENHILKTWNYLAQRQISTHLIEIESRPHITLFSSPTPSILEPSKLETLIKTFASKHEPFSLELSVIGPLLNDSNNGIILLLTPSLSILQFQSQLCDALKKEGIEIGAEYCFGSWIPYCSIAQQVPEARTVEALRVSRDLKLPVNGYAMDVGLVEFSPVRKLFSFQLGNNGSTSTMRFNSIF